MNGCFKQLYLFWFANEHVDFRIPELLSVIKLTNVNVKWVIKPTQDPFCVADLSSDEEALKISKRCICLRSIYKILGYGRTLEDLHKNLKSYPEELLNKYFQPHLSFRVQVETFGKTFTMKEKVDKIEMFNYLPAKGPVKLKNPDLSFYYIEYYGLNPNEAPPEPYYYFFSLWLCDGQRELIYKLSLKKRKFIGNTSMDPQLSLIMSNNALIKPGYLVLDPFVGTGSLLVAAAYFGAYVLGTDIDYLMLHGKSRPTRIQDRMKPRDSDESVYSNIKQYNKGSHYIDVIVGDSSAPFWHPNLIIDAIVTDPPYGIREATEKIGSAKEYTISSEHIQGHIPSKIEYGLKEIFTDLLNFSAKHLKLNGRLVSWIPTCKMDYDESILPTHPCLKLIYNSEQSLSGHTSRRLLTYEKICEPNGEIHAPNVTELFPAKFREQYFGQGETRKQRRARIAQELKDKGIVYTGRKSSER